MKSVGILGIGMYLPEEIRRNDWWPESVVAGWMAKRPAGPPPSPSGPVSAGAALVMKAMAEQAVDPFQGAVERHVMPPDMSVFDMEERAARMAIERSGIDPQQIGLLMTHTVVPEYLLGNPACILHQRLGLAKECFTTDTGAATYAFMMQLTLAETMLASGRARYALLVQSCGASRLLDAEDPVSPLFGDGATAVVVGPVANELGVLSSVHYTDSRYPRTLIASVRGGTWYDEGRAVLHVADPVQLRDVFLGTADVCKESIEAALAKSGHAAKDVDFFCIHQGTPWLRRIVQDHAGLGGARSVETFALTGYLFAAVLPAGLFVAERDGLLRQNALVVLAGGGPGQTYGAAVLRWGH